MTPSTQPVFLILDACVLIDYIKTDRFILELVGKQLGRVHVVSSVVDEVLDISSPQELTELGIEIVEPEMADAFTAAAAQGALSFADHLCLLTAKRNRFTCVTNDSSLRKTCERESVPTLWGLELLALLAEAQAMSGRDAYQVALAIQAINPRFITSKILKRLAKRLNI